MKKVTNVLALALAALAVSACNQVSGGDSSSAYSSSETSVSESEISTESSSSSSSSSQEASAWSAEEQALMLTYCGAVLPNPNGKLSGTITVEEVEDDDGYKSLLITDTASSFTLEEYYKALVAAGWNLITGYNGKAIQTASNGVEFAELTRDGEDGVGYDLIYSFNEGDSDTPSGNVIHCYNDLVSSGVDAKAWTDDDAATIKATVATTLPFVGLGSTNLVYAYSSNLLRIIDIYTKDLSASFAEALKADGWKTDSLSSVTSDVYVLNKTLADGASVEATLFYNSGNNFVFEYTPNVLTSTTWPSEFFADVEKQSGVTIPSFDTYDGGGFYYYKKNDVYVLQGLTEDFGIYDYEESLYEAGLFQSGWSDLFNGNPYFNWGETIAIQADTVYDNDYSELGIQLTVTATTPSSAFTSSWPSSQIASTLEDVLGVEGLSLPELSDIASLTDAEIKYEIRGEDYIASQYEYYVEEMTNFPFWYEELSDEPTAEEIEALAKVYAIADAGIVIKIKDSSEYASYDAYTEMLTNACWHLEGSTYEDADGKVAVTVEGDAKPDYSFYTTTITIKKGSGETHTPVFEFGSEEYEVGIGNSMKLWVNVDMLPYDITYSSDNPHITVNSKGFVTVSSDASEGETATITGTMTTASGEVKTATCTITAIKVLDYDKTSAIEAVLASLKEQGYESATIDDSDEDYPTIKLTFDTAVDTTVTSDSLMDLAENYLIPEGFEKQTRWDYDLDDEVAWANAWIYEDGEEVGKGKMMTATFTYQDDEFEKAQLSYYVYTPYDDSNSLILKIMAMDSDIFF